MDSYDIKEKQKEKSKLTLSLNKEVIQRAKDAGINISEITEKMLTAITLTPRGNSWDDLLEVYREFIRSIIMLIRKYGAEVEWKKELEGFPLKKIIRLDEDGLWVSSYFDEKESHSNFRPMEDPEEIASLLRHDLFELLENVINALTEAALRNKERMTQLEFALKLVKTLSEEEKGDDKN